MRVVLVHREWGIYLGACMGLGFWTKLDSAGQDSAVTFKSIEDAITMMGLWDEQPPLEEFSYPELNIDSGYATIEDCVAAGLERWDPNAIPDLPDDLPDEKPLREFVSTESLDEPNYVTRGKSVRKAVNCLSPAKVEILKSHLLGCGKKIHDCDLCYLLYRNVGGQFMVDCLLEQKLSPETAHPQAP